MLRLRAAVFRHVQDLPPHFFQQHRQGDLVERLTGGAESIEQLVVSGVVGAVSAAFSAAFYATAAFWPRWDLAPATFVPAPLFLLAARRFSGRIEQASRDGRVADGAITSVVEESLGNIVLTQAYNPRADGGETARPRGPRLDAGQCARGAAERDVRAVRRGRRDAVRARGDRPGCVGDLRRPYDPRSAPRPRRLLGYLYPPVRNLGQLGLAVTAATAGAHRIGEILDAEPAVTDPAGPVPQWPVQGWIGFHDVSFRYPGSPRASLRDAEFTAQPGELVLIAGASGAGKSTVAKLLTRFYEPLGRRDHPGRRTAHRRAPALPARAGRPAAAADLDPQRHHPREHRLRPPRRDGRRGRAGGAGRGGPRLHHRAPRRLRHPHRPRHRRPLRRPALGVRPGP